MTKQIRRRAPTKEPTGNLRIIVNLLRRKRGAHPLRAIRQARLVAAKRLGCSRHGPRSWPKMSPTASKTWPQFEDDEAAH
jgi:hypothetical protein